MADPDASADATVVDRTPGLSADDVAAQVGIDPRSIGRFQVLRRLGRGGMGVVYSAYDEELDRRVAIKLLRHDRLRDPASMQQFRAEAQAMARLSHANVVQIYEVGEHEGQLYIAMEFVQGRDLRRWLHERHPWRERLAALCQAGRGLEAAHAAGIVHRDFKPDNVMIDAGGRVRVLDFGLAQTREDRIDLGASQSSFDLELSRRSARGIAGTPAYMSPEQHASGVVDARSDQFSFCVVLYEAVYGERPFQASTAEALAALIASGKVKPPRAGSGVPRWLERAILRGLAVDPADRWPSMAALLAVAERDPARRRRHGWMGAVVVLSLVVAAAALWRGREDASARCEDAAQLTGVWDEARSAAVHAAMRATGVAYAERAWQTTREGLGAYAGAWSAMHVEVCAATHVRGEQSAELFDLRIGCLRRARTELDALVTVLAGVDASAMENVARTPGQLPRLAACADAEALRHARRPDARMLAAAEALRDELAPVKALIRVGRFAPARAALTPILTRAEALTEPGVLAEVLFYHGDLAGKLGDYAAAERGLLRSYTRAIAGEDDVAAARAAIESIFITGYLRAHLGDGERWAEIAGAQLDRLGEEGLLRGRLLNYAAILHEERGEKREAAALHERSVALNRRIEATPFTIAAGLNNLAVALGNTGRVDEAIAAYTEALAIYKDTVGEEHPNYATTLDNLGTAHSSRGELDVALGMHLDALRRRETSIDAGHPNLAVTLTNIADLQLDRGRPELALAYAERAAALTRVALGDEHPLARHCEVVLARVDQQRGMLTQARARIERVMPAMRAAAGERRTELVYPTLVLAEIDLASGRPAEAARGFAEVLALRDIESGATDRERGVASFGLLRARWEVGERDGLVALAEAAERHFAAIGDAGQRAALATWRREHSLMQ